MDARRGDAMAPHERDLLDVKGMSCPLPVLRANRALRGDGAGRAAARARNRSRGGGRLPGVLPGDRPRAAGLERGSRRVQLPHPPAADDHRNAQRTTDVPTALITHPACLEHDTGPYHPECPDRLRSVLARAGSRGVRRAAARTGAARDRRATHPCASARIRRGDPGHPARAGRDRATRRRHGHERRQRRSRAAGGGRCGRGGRCRDGRLGARGFRRRAPARAPRRADRPMGFCLFNNAADRRPACPRRAWGIERVAVVDFDVHHGNGTQAFSRPTRGCSTLPSTNTPAIPGTGHEGTRRRRQHRQRAAPARLGRQRLPRAPGVRRSSRAGRIRARTADRLGRIRRP